MAVSIEPAPGCVGDLAIHLAGELDIWSAAFLTQAVRDLRPVLRGAADRPSRIVLDLHELRFLDTGGLTALDDARNKLVAAGWVVTVGPAQRQVCQLLRLAHRCGWLVNGPLAVDDAAVSHVHITPSSVERRRRPPCVTEVRDC